MLKGLRQIPLRIAVIAILAAANGAPAVAQPGALPGDAAGLLPAQRVRGVSLQQAIAIATDRVSGRVVRADTINREGRVVHEILIINDDGLVRTVHVDAATGNVL